MTIITPTQRNTKVRTATAVPSGKTVHIVCLKADPSDVVFSTTDPLELHMFQGSLPRR